MSLIDAFIGKTRAPYYAQITIDTRSGNLHLTFNAQSESGVKTEFSKEYPGPYVTGGAVQDLMNWLKETARRFFGEGG